jgi:hypothetical protein
MESNLRDQSRPSPMLIKKKCQCTCPSGGQGLVRRQLLLNLGPKVVDRSPVTSVITSHPRPSNPRCGERFRRYLHWETIIAVAQRLAYGIALIVVPAPRKREELRFEIHKPCGALGKKNQTTHTIRCGPSWKISPTLATAFVESGSSGPSSNPSVASLRMTWSISSGIKPAISIGRRSRSTLRTRSSTRRGPICPFPPDD